MEGANISKDQDNHTLLVIPCKDSIDWNTEYGIYYCSADHPQNEAFRYLAFYDDKSIRAIGEVENCISLKYKARNKELKFSDWKFECTKEQKERLKRAFPSAPHHPCSNCKFYIMKEMLETDFKKSSKGGSQAFQYMDLANFIGKEILQRNDIRKIAKALKQVTWINKDTPGEVIGDSMEEEALKKELQKLLEANKNLVLTGAPGTGKTYLAKEIAKKLTGAENNEDKKSKEYWDFVQFHPSYDYTDFVEGLRPVQDDEGHVGFERRDGIFMAFCRKAAENYKADPEQNYVFIIDEINRAEPSRVFGELFYALEPDYRGPEGRVKTQYSNLAAEDDTFEKGFYIPKNVYIIGTMNDIDRSVDSFDFAMRRRFVWREIAVEDTQEAILSSLDEPWLGSSIKALNAINNHIDKMSELGKAYHIGAAYMMKVKNYKPEQDWNQAWVQVWELHLRPLFAEYLRGMPNAEEHVEKLYRIYRDLDESKQEEE